MGVLNVLIDGTLAHCVTGSAVFLFGQGFFTICSNVTQSCSVYGFLSGVAGYRQHASARH